MWFSRPSRKHHRPTRRTTSSSSSSHRRHHRSMSSGAISDNGLRDVARETIHVLPAILDQLRLSKKASEGFKYSPESLPRLDPNDCPQFPHPATIDVVNKDTLDAAIQLTNMSSHDGENGGPRSPYPRAMIVNFANERRPGGGWTNGKMAQEEAICYRSSLCHSIRERHYPLECDEIIYSPFVLVIRESLAEGHRLYSDPMEDLPAVSCVTVAALRQPRVRTFTLNRQGGGRPYRKHTFQFDQDRNKTKIKMRQTLRAAAFHKKHTLVLGALGCGVYANPAEDVAHCWLEVLREDEFTGNWWRNICFAVYDPRDEGNFRTFGRVLAGQLV